MKMMHIGFLIVLIHLLTGEAQPENPCSVPPLKMSKSDVKVAAVQMSISGEFLEKKDLAEAFRPFVERAAGDGADLIVFPEYVLGAFKMDDQRVQRICDMAAKNNIALVVGGWEFFPESEVIHPPQKDSFSNTLLVVNRKGEIVGKHRKMHAAIAPNSPYFWPPEEGEDGENIMRLGDGSPVIDLDFGRIGLLTCYDGYFFSSFEIPALKGAEILIWANGRGGAVEEHFVRTASFMTCTHIITTNQAIGAGTMICAYPGTTLAIAEEPGEKYLVASLNLTDLRHQRKNNRMFHQRRPEIYRDLTEPWKPWEAYPEIPFFTYPEKKKD